MIELPKFQLRAVNYKSFSRASEGFSCIKPVNVIIGRNNAGKSALIDVVAKAVDHSITFAQGYRGEEAGVEGAFPATIQFFNEYLKGHGKQGNNDDRVELKHSEYGGWIDPKEWAGAHLRTFVVNIRLLNAEWRVVGLSGPESSNPKHEYIRGEILELLKKRPVVGPFRGKKFVRVSAERDILPEQKAGDLIIRPNGSGATNVLSRFLTEQGLPPDLIERDVLNALNLIVQPDMSFSRISSRQIVGGQWEVELHDNAGERVGLSHMGSGVKTVLLVLVSLLVVPHIQKTPASEFIFGFEELENNLHPSLQRRLFQFVRNFVINTHAIVFLTTHSSVVIDQFSSDDTAQLLHVSHDGESANVKTIDSWSSRHSALDDLGVRASDLLQSNGLIWVEGPSDRVYVNRWIELWTEGKLKEGVHYRCVPYGGAILSHFSVADPSDINDFIAVMQINRKAAVLMDSDKRNSETPLKDRVERICKEAAQLKAMAWVTDGREVENYIPLDAIKQYLGKESISQPEKYDDVLELLQNELERKSSLDKVDLAHQIAKKLSREMLQATLDLPQKLEQLCSCILSWNNT